MAQPPLDFAAVILEAPEDPSAVTVAGLPLAVRQARLLRDAGARWIGAASPGARELLARWFENPDFALSAEAVQARSSRVISLAGDRVIDVRLLKALASRPFPCAVAANGEEEPAAVLRDGGADPAAGALLAPADIDPYVISTRSRQPVRIERVRNRADAAEVERHLILDGRKGVLDWPARFIHRPLEALLVRALWPTPITPNQISAATLVLGLVGVAAFWTGRFGWGMAIALVVGVLDGVDGLLARTRLQVTPVGELEHTADKVVEYGWYIALGVGLMGQGGWAPVLTGVAASVLMLLDVVVGASAQKLLGRQLEDAGGFERGFRLIAARRNTNIWMLLGFGLVGAWLQGLAAIALWTGVSLAVRAWRLAVRRAERGRAYEDEAVRIASAGSGGA